MDLKVLPMLNIRPQIYHNIQKIREIHESFLAQIQTISPMSADPAPEGLPNFLPRSKISKRLSVPGLRGLQSKSLRTRKLKAAFDQHLKALVAEPMECLEVVREIDKLVSHNTQCQLIRKSPKFTFILQSVSFSAYEEFCSNYELLTQDVALLRRSVPNWIVFEQGIEALSKSVASTENRRNDDNRSMLMNDLMIKVYTLLEPEERSFETLTELLADPTPLQISSSSSRPPSKHPCW